MKKITLIAAGIAAATATAGAFTLDAVGYGGSELSANPETVNVDGYGDLVFESVSGSTLVVNSAYQNDNGFGGPSLNFKSGDVVRITFTGLDPLNVDFDFVGLSAGESFTIEPDTFTPQAFLLTFNGTDEGAGLYAVSWNVVPEPSSALLGVLGASLLVFRRRR